MSCKTLLHQLYEGQVHPVESIYPKAPEYAAALHRLDEQQQYFRTLLSEDDWSRFEACEKLHHQCNRTYSYENFLYGFHLGAGLMLELLTEKT